MGKRKGAIPSDEDDDGEFTYDSSNDSGEEKPKRVPQQKGKLKEDDERDQLESDEEPLTKKPKTEKRSNRSVLAEEGTNVLIRCTSDGDKYIDLGKKKRATIRNFKGNILVDIREFYGADGDEKPGKKGISLNREQWEVLKSSANAIDNLFAEMK